VGANASLAKNDDPKHRRRERLRLKSFSIRNFRSIRELDVEFPESALLVLVGANNSGKSNIIRAIDNLCGDGWFGREKLETYDHYLRDPDREIHLQMDFADGRQVAWNSGDKWPIYRSQSGEKLWKQNVKDDFPCVYLGADRSLDDHIGYNEWTLLSKIKRHFHKRAQSLETEIQDRFEEVIGLFGQVEGFTDFCSGFSKAFSQLQGETSAKALP
jgi:putative ATP-dependent endonuclease of the OLD family